YRYLRPFMIDKEHEEIWLLMLDRAKHVKAKVMVSSGGTAATVGDEKIILKHAITHLASSIILAHNHPSNNLRPSIQDDALTERVRKACDAVGIHLDDHIIVCRNNYYSYQIEGKL
ncbi:MAG: JAB domain-containing protein, partial [Muribaculaceae bacterium]|nr:JAB domain-containing protein [Muribaculaceae bacterium]